MNKNKRLTEPDYEEAIKLLKIADSLAALAWNKLAGRPKSTPVRPCEEWTEMSATSIGAAISELRKAKREAEYASTYAGENQLP